MKNKTGEHYVVNTGYHVIKEVQHHYAPFLDKTNENKANYKYNFREGSFTVPMAHRIIS